MNYLELANIASHAALELDNVRLNRHEGSMTALAELANHFLDNIQEDAETISHPKLDSILLVFIWSVFRNLYPTEDLTTIKDTVRAAREKFQWLKDLAQNYTYDSKATDLCLEISRRAQIRRMSIIPR